MAFHPKKMECLKYAEEMDYVTVLSLASTTHVDEVVPRTYRFRV